MKKILILPLVLFFLVQGSMAQTPKWVEKAKRAVFSVVTYDKNDKMLNTGNGFFVSEDGLALSDYSLFKGAERAVVITADGKQMPVDVILGANDMYDVIKLCGNKGGYGQCLKEDPGTGRLCDHRYVSLWNPERTHKTRPDLRKAGERYEIWKNKNRGRKFYLRKKNADQLSSM